MKIDLNSVEEAAKTLYIRALKILPDDVKRGFEVLSNNEEHPTGQRILATMVENIAVAEETNNLLCQDTGIPIYNVSIGRNVQVDGYALKEAIRRGCTRATKEHPLRSSVVHPISRINEHTSGGHRVPVINIDFIDEMDRLTIDMIPKGSGSENGSFLKMCIPADGINGVKKFVIDKVMEAGGKVCPPTIVGVGVGGTSDLCTKIAKLAASRPIGSVCDDPDGAKLEAELSEAVNSLGIGAQGLGGNSTAFAVHVETAATHITMNPVAVNIMCNSARRARATFTPGSIEYGF